MVTVCCQWRLDEREAIVCLLEMMEICSNNRCAGAYNTYFRMGTSRMNTVTMSTGIILKKQQNSLINGSLYHEIEYK